ncbi:MAG: MYXO-CTERM sorting domain-containing protein [Pseudomonadota bacterium]|nr:MYXO-CTERM sorting domain-containing protein [Pseudomonadota bacterium]
MLILVSSALAFESEPVDVLLQDQSELFTNVEVSTGFVPSGSPLQVEFRIEANGGAGVEMEGEGSLWWPEALTLDFTGKPGSGIYLLDASIDAVATVRVDLWGTYTDDFEVDRRSIYMDGATFFDPFVMDGAVDDRVEVIDSAAGTELLNYAFDIFLGVSLQFTADMTPTFTAGFEGVQWAVNEGTILAEGAPATMAPERAPDYLVESVFTALWDARFDLIFTPTISVCAPVYGCFDVLTFDIPLELLSDSFEQDFPPALYTFPLPLLEPGLSAGDLGTILPGTISNLEVPLTNVGNLPVFGDATIEGDGEFSVYPTQFNANPGTTDGLVITFAPTVDGPQTATLVLTSNDPSIPMLTIPLTGNAETPANPGEDDVPGEEQVVVTEEIGGCGCDTPGSPATGALGALAAAALLVRRRRA